MSKSKSVVDLNKYNYKVTKVRDKEGKIRHSAGVDDAVARALLGADIDAVVKANGLKVKEGGNSGLYRMAVGHALRGLVRNGTPVKIGKHTIKTLKQKIALPKAA